MAIYFKNLKLKKIKEYDKIIKKYRGGDNIIIEMDAKQINSKSNLYEIFRKKVNAPNHFYNNLDAFNDLLYDFFELDNPKNMIILVTNYSKTENTKLAFFEKVLNLFNGAVGYWKKHREATFAVIIFEDK